ncbi:MAG TPA: peptidoglycan-binding domain-containing protein [Myxococcales bacterium]|nr:peptidoglycan-binding domain-containing protein [Myxococcales bacterium]
MAVGPSPGLAQALTRMLEKPAALPPLVGPDSPPQAVSQVQKMVKQLGYQLAPKEDIANDYGPSTKAAVRQFQKSHQLPETGVADQVTQGKMMEAIKSLEQKQRDLFQPPGAKHNNDRF